MLTFVIPDLLHIRLYLNLLLGRPKRLACRLHHNASIIRLLSQRQVQLVGVTVVYGLLGGSQILLILAHILTHSNSIIYLVRSFRLTIRDNWHVESTGTLQVRIVLILEILLHLS